MPRVITDATVSWLTSLIIPRSVTIAVINWPGVTSNAGLKAVAAAGAD